MKKSLVLATVVLGLGFTLVARFADTPLYALSLPAVLGGVFGSGLLLFAFSDYSRRPRFRVYSARKAFAPKTTSQIDLATEWTYTILST